MTHPALGGVYSFYVQRNAYSSFYDTDCFWGPLEAMTHDHHHHLVVAFENLGCGLLLFSSSDTISGAFRKSLPSVTYGVMLQLKITDGLPCLPVLGMGQEAIFLASLTAFRKPAFRRPATDYKHTTS